MFCSLRLVNSRSLPISELRRRKLHTFENWLLTDLRIITYLRVKETKTNVSSMHCLAVSRSLPISELRRRKPSCVNIYRPLTTGSLPISELRRRKRNGLSKSDFRQVWSLPISELRRRKRGQIFNIQFFHNLIITYLRVKETKTYLFRLHTFLQLPFDHYLSPS